eukprot:scaffold13496_cov36-Phaeocystis_antarctica.AAC.1
MCARPEDLGRAGDTGMRIRERAGRRRGDAAGAAAYQVGRCTHEADWRAPLQTHRDGGVRLRRVLVGRSDDAVTDRLDVVVLAVADEHDLSHLAVDERLRHQRRDRLHLGHEDEVRFGEHAEAGDPLVQVLAHALLGDAEEGGEQGGRLVGAHPPECSKVLEARVQHGARRAVPATPRQPKVVRPEVGEAEAHPDRPGGDRVERVRLRVILEARGLGHIARLSPQVLGFSGAKRTPPRAWRCLAAAALLLHRPQLSRLATRRRAKLAHLLGRATQEVLWQGDAHDLSGRRVQRQLEPHVALRADQLGRGRRGRRRRGGARLRGGGRGRGGHARAPTLRLLGALLLGTLLAQLHVAHTLQRELLIAIEGGTAPRCVSYRLGAQGGARQHALTAPLHSPGTRQAEEALANSKRRRRPQDCAACEHISATGILHPDCNLRTDYGVRGQVRHAGRAELVVLDWEVDLISRLAGFLRHDADEVRHPCGSNASETCIDSATRPAGVLTFPLPFFVARSSINSLWIISLFTGHDQRAGWRALGPARRRRAPCAREGTRYPRGSCLPLGSTKPVFATFRDFTFTTTFLVV